MASTFCRDAGGDGSRARRTVPATQEKIELLSFERLDIHTLPGKKEKALEKMMAWEPEELAGLKVETINRIDGIKILLEGGSWCLVRASGTENVFRIYLEAPDRGLFEKMQQELRQQLKI